MLGQRELGLSEKLKPRQIRDVSFEFTLGIWKPYLSGGFPESLGPLGLPGILFLLEISVALRSEHDSENKTITNPSNLHITYKHTFEAGCQIRIHFHLTWKTMHIYWRTNAAFWLRNLGFYLGPHICTVTNATLKLCLTKTEWGQIDICLAVKFPSTGHHHERCINPRTNLVFVRQYL